MTKKHHKANRQALMAARKGSAARVWVKIPTEVQAYYDDNGNLCVTEIRTPTTRDAEIAIAMQLSLPL